MKPIPFEWLQPGAIVPVTPEVVRDLVDCVRVAYRAGQEAEREACAKVCDDQAARCEAAAQSAIEDGEHDEVSAIRSTAWKLSVCAAAIRVRGQA